ncbi:MAG: TRAP transporter fused permease subunit [Burkholderiales bacterium]|nr:TRAP transporter fused permease subunit [Burkholderiales bacterium]
MIHVWAFGVAVFTIAAAAYLSLAPWLMTAVFICACMVPGFLMVGASERADPRRPAAFDWVLSAVSAIVLVYFVAYSEYVTTRIALLNALTPADFVIGTAMLVLTLELTRRSTGLALSLIVLLFILYNLYGHLVGGSLGHGQIDYAYFLDLAVFTTDGIMGLPLRVVATYAFLFVMFGGLLHATRGGDFFYDLAAALTGGRVGGPAKVAVVSSGLYGTVSGSPTSDVVTTGSITIPIMKRLGYRPTVAAAIEVAASTGGSILPPVMGSAAFLMAEYTGIEYREIAVAAVLPALLYYVAIYAQVHFHSINTRAKGFSRSELPSLASTMSWGWPFLIPIAALVWTLMAGYTPTYAALAASATLLVAATFNRRMRIGVMAVARALAETTLRVLPVAGACAAAGLVIAGITMTGLAPKFSMLVAALTGSGVFGTLAAAALVTIVLGMGMPTPSAYILAAVMLGPLLAQVGVPTLPAHMFLLYFASMSALTPPVAVAAYAAAPIANANPFAIAAMAVRFALAAFIVPFAFVYGQGLLMVGPGWEVAVDFGSAAVGVVLLALAVEGSRGYGRSLPSRLLLAGAGLCFIVPALWSLGVGLILGLMSLALDRAGRSRTVPRVRPDEVSPE